MLTALRTWILTKLEIIRKLYTAGENKKILNLNFQNWNVPVIQGIIFGRLNILEFLGDISELRLHEICQLFNSIVASTDNFKWLHFNKLKCNNPSMHVAKLAIINNYGIQLFNKYFDMWQVSNIWERI